MPACPYCGYHIVLREVPHQGFFRSDRKCPECGGNFTVDTKTKYRQAAFIVILLISLAFTILLYYQVSIWLFPALVSYTLLGVILYWGNKKLYLVPFPEDFNSNKDN
jgi:DNA-directed RNA polymerase subunit RPC12/RpoP